jgi:hypothetical protein
LETTGTALPIIRVLTQWTVHYQAYKCLLELNATLQMLVSAEAARPEKKMIITGDKKVKDHATEMLNVIMNSTFWHAIAQ